MGEHQDLSKWLKNFPVLTAPVTTQEGEFQRREFDMKTISATDAHFIRQWQIAWLRDNPAAAPHEIREATQKAIQSGEIKLQKQ